ncbi:MAG: RES domain-containing protein [Chitinophagaceae bacterium]|nr:MAG: RES domain-containing protein [Chitinophagaceae bacterium]
MEAYRITLEKYAKSLVASGIPARWNSRDINVIYAAGSRALACLENVVHRNSLGSSHYFKTVRILVPDNLVMEEILLSDLDTDWMDYRHYPYTQGIGDAWVVAQSSAVLRVPSAIIPAEYNYLINPLHRDFRKIKHNGVEPFYFDKRIKSISTGNPASPGEAKNTGSVRTKKPPAKEA